MTRHGRHVVCDECGATYPVGDARTSLWVLERRDDGPPRDLCEDCAGRLERGTLGEPECARCGATESSPRWYVVPGVTRERILVCANCRQPGDTFTV